MNLKILDTIFVFAGGIGMFIYGMNIMADGLQKTAGNKMKNMLTYLTNNRVLAVVLGAFITVIIQSSSATTVLVVGFVNAGMINLSQSVGIIMGANIGTTVTAWLVSMNEWSKVLKPEFFAPLFIAIGAFTKMFTKSEKKKEISDIIIGFGILFVGLTLMGDVIAPYHDSPIFAKAFSTLGGNPLLAILVGAVVTGIIQSSSASVGILQTLALGGVVSWKAAIFITLGQNIGTCVTSLISGIGANKTAKRAAAMHLLFNVIGSVLFGIISFIIFRINPALGEGSINSVQISLFHTVFNVGSAIVLFPFADYIVKLSGVFIDDSKDEVSQDEYGITLRHLDERIFETPSFAVQNSVKEAVHIGEITLSNLKESVNALLEKDKKSIKKVLEIEKIIDSHCKVLSEYLIKINNLSLTQVQHLTVNKLFYIISNIERVGDHAENLAELALERLETDIRFTEDAYNDLKNICDESIKAFKYAIDALETEDIEFIIKVKNLERVVDKLEDDLRSKHIARLSAGECSSETGVLYIDALINIERISDQSLNIANYVNDQIKQGV